MTHAAFSGREMGSDELAAAFETGELFDGPFSHRDHVRVAWRLLRQHPLGLAMHRMTEGIEVLARQRGLPDLFHQTITSFYMLAIADCLSRSAACDTFESFASQHPALLGDSRAFLLGFYTAETLDSATARDGFVLPDRLDGATRPDISPTAVSRSS